MSKLTPNEKTNLSDFGGKVATAASSAGVLGVIVGQALPAAAAHPYGLPAAVAGGAALMGAAGVVANQRRKARAAQRNAEIKHGANSARQ